MESLKAAEHGLKLLTICPDNDHKLHNSCIMTSNLMSPPSSPAFSQVGDYIGTESCVDMKNDEADSDEAASSMGFGCQRTYQCNRDQRRRVMTTKKREIPPPISLRMPFVLKRYYTADGRLILREERVRHHEYFKAHRSNGHLTLQLVLIDDHDDEDDFWYVEQYNADKEEEEVAEPELETGDFGEKVEFVDKTDKVDKEVENGGENKCLNYSSVIRGGSSCFLGLPVPAIKPVHS